ncbi:MAG: hypothetical protein CMO26_14140 [Thiotrichales bacterium]|nr:hypothetical protein [Thiotrichales bacterium]
MSSEKLETLLGKKALDALTRPTAAASGLPGPAFSSDEFYALECERLFARTWMCAGFGLDIPNPGDAMPVELPGAPLLLVRGNDHQVRAFHNVCRHRGNIVLDKPCKAASVIACPYHRWTYELTGELRATPHFGGNNVGFEGSGLDKSSLGLKPVRLVAWHDWLFVNLDGGAPPFETYASGLIEHLQGYDFSKISVGAVREFSFRSNWKNVAENFLETYHTHWVHPGLVNRYASVYKSDRDAADATRTKFQNGTFFTSHLDLPPETEIETFGLPRITGQPDIWSHRLEYFFQFPNLIVFVEPGGVVSIIDYPRSAALTEQRWHLCFAKEAENDTRYDEARMRTLDFWTEVNEEDIGVCETLQRGRASRAMDGGVFSPYWEGESHGFQQLVIESMR